MVWETTGAMLKSGNVCPECGPHRANAGIKYDSLTVRCFFFMEST